MPDRKYNTATTIYFPIIAADDTAFAEDATIVADEAQISIDGGAFADTTNTPTHVGFGIYSLDLTAAELLGKNIIIVLFDRTTSSVFEDQAIEIETYGHASALHAFDRNTATQDVNVTQISGDATAADDLELYIEGSATSSGEPPRVNVTEWAEGEASSLRLAELIRDDITYSTIGTGSFAALLSSKATALDFDRTTDSLEALRDIKVYHADIQLQVDDTNSQDEYTVTWFGNGERITSGITSPTIQVVKRSDGSDLIASTALTEIGSTHSFKVDSTTQLTAGETYLVIAAATIDSGSRSFSALLGRDASG